MDSQSAATLELLESLIQIQKKKILEYGRKIVPRLTPEDILQPNDYLELEHHPFFRYEEGILHGMQSAQAAIQALYQEMQE